MKHAALQAGVALAAAIFIASALQCPGAAGSPVKTSAARETWWDARWHYRMFVTVNSTGYPRDDYPVELSVNFAGHLAGKLDNNSIRVVQIGMEMPSQYDPGNRTAGTLIFVVNGTTPAHALRNFTVYYDSEENGLKSVADYGEPDYVTDYKKLIEDGKLLGSSPLNGTTDSWWFPPFLNHGKYQYQNMIVGDVKAVVHAWGDGWSGSKWIRHYADATIYRDSFNSYIKLWNNGSATETVWASGLANISTGQKFVMDEETKDGGLHVITSDWSVNNVSALDYDGIGTKMASIDTDTYQRHVNGTFSFEYEDGVTPDEVLIIPRTDGIIDFTVTGSVSGDVTADCSISMGVYYQNLDISLATLVDGETIMLEYKRKVYDFLDVLTVVSKTASTDYLILYDSDNIDGVPYAEPQIGALIFPEPIAASDMVVEFWQNKSLLPGPNTPVFEYYINVSTNYNEWWFNATDPDHLHDPQVNQFDLIAAYMNGSSNPKQETSDTRNSYNNPAIVKIEGHESGIPIGLTVNSPYNGQMFNGWMNLPGNPMSDAIPIRAAAAGDTIYRLYYSISDGPAVDFNGSADVPISNVSGDAIDGHVYIKVTAVDTSGANITRYVLIYVPKTFWQHILSSVGSIFVVLIVLIGGFIGICGVASIKKKRSANFGRPNI